MADKILIAASLFILVIQVESKALQINNEKNRNSGLEILKNIAMETITRYHSQVKEVSQQHLNKIIKYSGDIEKDNDLLHIVEDRGANSEKTVNERAKELVHKGRQDAKPVSYFICVEKNRKKTELTLKEHQNSYKNLTEKVQGKAMKKAQVTRLALERMNSAFDGLLEEYEQEINACHDVQCVEDGVARAWKTFKWSKRIVTDFTVSFMKEYQIFLLESYNNLDKASTLMADALSRGIQNMNEC